VVNWLHAHYPSLIKLDFLQKIKTPIIKAYKGKKVLEFYNEQDYLKWKNTIDVKNYKIKYFKGLATSTKDDAKSTFKNLKEMQTSFYYKDSKCDDAILLAFDKDKNNKTLKKDVNTESEESENESESNTLLKCSDRRKNWLSNYDKNVYIDNKETKTSYQDFIHKELIHFSVYDNSRSIPNLCDGLKPSQRKILYYMLKKNIVQDIKVAQLSGYVSAETGYHHGEVSLQGAIINMAQDFTGTNNINLLYPEGEFGNIIGGSKSAGSPRYLFTRLAKNTQYLFNKLDLPLLNYLEDDGLIIEPEYFIPVIPMILVNGCTGIGTGFSTSIPCYNPIDIIENLLLVLQEDVDPLEMTPYFRNFKGTVIPDTSKKGGYFTKGKYQKLSNTQIKITDLPIGTWIDHYKIFLESFIEGNNNSKKEKSKVKSKKFTLKSVDKIIVEESDTIFFILEFKEASELATLIKNKTLEKELKLIKPFSINNMYLFNDALQITKYSDPNEILLDFYDIRINYYQKRRKYYIKELSLKYTKLSAQARFIEEYITGNLNINRKSEEYIIQLLLKMEYPIVDNDSTFNYLTSMPIRSLSKERIEQLKKQCENTQMEINFYKTNSCEKLWELDLRELLTKLKSE
jgi:DNA topoisomerase-2